MINRIMKGATVFLAGLAVATLARAVVIEGTTPSGKFKTVFVTETGRLPVETSTGSLQHVVVDSGTITSYQGGTWSVGTAVGVALTVTASTATDTISGGATIGAVAGVVYPADPNRKQGVVCNLDSDAVIKLGSLSSQNMTLPAGGCYSPDVPSSFTGALYGVSTGPVVSYSYIYHY